MTNTKAPKFTNPLSLMGEWHRSMHVEGIGTVLAHIDVSGGCLGVTIQAPHPTQGFCGAFNPYPLPFDSDSEEDMQRVFRDLNENMDKLFADEATVRMVYEGLINGGALVVNKDTGEVRLLPKDESDAAAAADGEDDCDCESCRARRTLMAMLAGRLGKLVKQAAEDDGLDAAKPTHKGGCC